MVWGMISPFSRIVAAKTVARDVHAVGVFVRSDAEQLTRLVELVNSGTLRVGVAERVPLAELPSVHARADAGELSGKVILLAPTA